MRQRHSVSVWTLLVICGLGVSACGDRDAKRAAEGAATYCSDLTFRRADVEGYVSDLELAIRDPGTSATDPTRIRACGAFLTNVGRLQGFLRFFRVAVAAPAQSPPEAAKLGVALDDPLLKTDITIEACLAETEKSTAGALTKSKAVLKLFQDAAAACEKLPAPM